MPATEVCQRKIDSEGYGISQRLKILTGKYSYVDNETHRAAPTRQGHNSGDLGAHAVIGLNQHKNDHLRSMYVFVLLGVARAIPVCHLWADFAMTGTTGGCQLTTDHEGYGMN